MLKNVDHPSCIKLYETFEDERNVFLVTEYFLGYLVYAKGDSSLTGYNLMEILVRRMQGRYLFKSLRRLTTVIRIKLLIGI